MGPPAQTAMRTAADPAILRAARAKIADPKTWHRGEAAYLADGTDTSAADPKATQWSGWGALEALTGQVASADVALLEQTAQQLHGRGFIDVDDQLGHDAVLQVYDAAIAAAAGGSREAQPRLPFAGRTPSPTPSPSAPATESRADASVPAVRTGAALPDIEVGRGVYREIGGLMDAFSRLDDRFHTCFPMLKPDIIAPLCSIALRPVAIDGRKDSADIYEDTQNRGKYAISKIGLDKFAAALGITWHPIYTARVDDESQPYYCRFRACGVFYNFDGQQRVVTKHKTVDLRDGSPQAVGMSERELARARKYVDALAESKAMNRVVRTVAFLKGSYSLEELGKPFVVAALVFTGETDDPEMKKLVVEATLQRHLGAADALFGPPTTAPKLAIETGQRTAPPPTGTTDDDPDGDDDKAPY